MIDHYISHWAPESDETMSASLRHILRFWESNKQDLYTLLGGLIIKKPVVYEKNADEIRNEIYELLDTHPFCLALRHHNYGWLYFSELLYPRYLIENKYNGSNYTIHLPSGKDYEVKNGTKLMKIFGKIAEAFEIEGFEDFRIQHSRIFNQKKLAGTLCLSIHPLDYMTMSDNDCGWSSCMSWQEHGDYRQGTVEMMNSKYVVVAYLQSEKKHLAITDNYTWNSKKWRQLFIVDKNIIVGNRQYPYINDELAKTALSWLKQLAEENLGWQYADSIETINNYASKNGTHISLITRMMYNDFHTDHFAYINYDVNNIMINFSGESECMFCGENISNYDNIHASMLSCPDCNGMKRCSYCGDYHDESELYETERGLVCEYCLEESFSKCDGCDRLVETESSGCIEVRVSFNDEDQRYYTSLCRKCYLEFCDNMDIDPDVEEQQYIRYIYIEDLTIDEFNILTDYIHFYGRDYDKYEEYILSKTEEEEEN
jgi:hypothetical protein